MLKILINTILKKYILLVCLKETVFVKEFMDLKENMLQ